MPSPRLFFRVAKWESFQHYKDRNPPWIKLHRELLTSETWISLSDAGRVLAIAIMLLAADTDNRIPENKDFVKRRAYLHKDPDFQPLFDCGFIEYIDEITKSASNNLADDSTMRQSARPETETYREETEKKEIEGALAPDLSQAAVDVWNDLAKELGLPQVQRLTKTRLGKLRARLSECGGLEGWSAACAKVRAAGWMAGDNDKGWKADFDFMLQEKSFTKLMEGSYDRAKSHRQSFGNGFAAIAAGEAD